MNFLSIEKVNRGHNNEKYIEKDYLCILNLIVHNLDIAQLQQIVEKHPNITAAADLLKKFRFYR